MQKPTLLVQARAIARARHLSHRTENAYHNFIKRYIIFHDKRHPNEMGADEITAFLTHLAVEEKGFFVNPESSPLCLVVSLS